MLRTLAQLAAVNPGYVPEGVLTVNTQYPQSPLPNGDAGRQFAQFADRLVDDLRRSPGISAAAVAWPVDLIGPSWAPFANFHDRPFPAGQEPAVQMASVSTSYFETMRIPLRTGRLFGAQDRGGAPVVAVINEEVVRRFLPEGDPVGQRMSLVGIPELQDVEIVGVVGNTLRVGLAGRLVPEVYCAYAQFPTPGPTVVVRASAGDPLLLVRTVDDRIAARNPEVATYGAKRLDDAIAGTVGDRRVLSLLLGMFAALALVLTGLGIAGVVSFIVAQRTQEIGVRMALGADPRSVLWMVLRGAMIPVAVGIVIGAVATLPFTRLIQGFLFQVTPTDPLTLAAGAVMLVLGALAAAYVPARRATRIDPLVALRHC